MPYPLLRLSQLTTASWIVDPEQPILLVLEDDQQPDKVLALFLRTGYTSILGYLTGGMRAWNNAVLPATEVTQMPVHDVENQKADLQIIDVRSPEEWDAGHVPDAIHMFLPELRGRSAELVRHKPVATYCNSGYRASLAASILQQEGFQARNIPGSWQAW